MNRPGALEHQHWSVSKQVDFYWDWRLSACCPCRQSS